MEIPDLLRESVSFLREGKQFIEWRRRTGDGRTGTIRCEDIDVFYEEYGRGEPVLLLHGGFTFAESWAGQIAALAGRYRVVACDSRGHARTGLGSLPLTYMQMARDVIALIEQLELGRVHIVGHSDGGATCIAAALQRPDLLKSMVLLGTPFNIANYDGDSWMRIESFLKPGSPILLMLRIMRRCLQPRRRDWRAFFEKMTRMWRTLPDFSRSDLASIKVPTLVVACDRDEFLSHAGDPLEVFVECAESIPGARLVEIPGGTHMVALQKPETVSRVILDFLSTLEEAGATRPAT